MEVAGATGALRDPARRAERVTQHVRTVVEQAGPLPSASNEALDDPFSQRTAVVLVEHERPAEVTVIAKRRRESRRQRDVAQSATLRRRDVPLSR
jgi:hypothetical protein